MEKKSAIRDRVMLVAIFTLMLTGGVLMFSSWELRTRLFSYIPIALFFGHVGIFFLASFRRQYWGLFKAYFLVPLFVYFAFFCHYVKIYSRSEWGNPLGFLQLPLAPFIQPAVTKKNIGYKKANMRRKEIMGGGVDIEKLILSPRQLSEAEREGIIYRLKQGQVISPFLLDMLVLSQEWGGSYEDKYAIDFLLKHPNTSQTTIRQFYTKNHFGHFGAIIDNPNTPIDLIESMAQADNLSRKVAAIQSNRLNDSLKKKTMWDIVRTKYNPSSHRAKSYVAGMRDISPEMLKEMTGFNASLDFDIAKNPNVTSAMLLEFASHPSSLVRSAVAMNPRTPKEAFYRLIRGEDGKYLEWWRLSKFAGEIERNHNTPEEILLLLEAIENEGKSNGQ